MTKNIIICCDGTANEIEADLSNVLKLYRIVEKDDAQVVFYDPGIGTIGTQSNWLRFTQKTKEVTWQATGTGLEDNVLDAYKFLIDVWKPEDRIFLFGFSRGAYTVRVLAGFIYLMGLLRPEQKNLSEYSFRAYKHASEKNDLKIAWGFREITRARTVPIKFIGVWDTVSSVIIPRPDSLIGIDQQRLPYTRTNPSVEVLRHAIAIDEKRRMFRVNRWIEPQKYDPNPFSDKDNKDQDIKQVWFAGCHSDVGGGYPEAESGPAKFPLKWMLLEAEAYGLRLNHSLFDHLVLGKERKEGKRFYTAPSVTAKLHESLTKGWQPLEYLPRQNKLKEWAARKSIFGLYLPRGEPRAIPEDALIHHSVQERLAADPSYKPDNLPKKYRSVYDSGEAHP